MQPRSGAAPQRDVARFNPHPARRPDATPAGMDMTRIRSCFNPHPARRPDATPAAAGPSGSPSGFNPHPARRPDATNWKRSGWRTRPSFNPHPARRPDATVYVSSPEAAGDSVFQSSSGQKAGCNELLRLIRSHRVCVSILIRPEGRMQRATAKGEAQIKSVFQSSSGQKAGCNPLP